MGPVAKYMPDPVRSVKTKSRRQAETPSERPIWVAAADLLGHVFACLLCGILMRFLQGHSGRLFNVPAAQGFIG